MSAFDRWSRRQLPEPPTKEAVEAIIAAARATAVATALQKAEEEAGELAKAEEKAKQIEKKQARKEKEKKKPSLSKEEKEALKEKKLKKMVGAVVVKTMSKHREYMGHDQFKEYAKEVCFFLPNFFSPLTHRYLVDGDYLREGEEVFKLQRREIGGILG
jgi:nitroreductase